MFLHQNNYHLLGSIIDINFRKKHIAEFRELEDHSNDELSGCSYLMIYGILSLGS